MGKVAWLVAPKEQRVIGRKVGIRLNVTIGRLNIANGGCFSACGQAIQARSGWVDSKLNNPCIELGTTSSRSAWVSRRARWLE